MGFLFLFALKSDEHHLYAKIARCVTYCGFHPTPSSSTPSWVIWEGTWNGVYAMKPKPTLCLPTRVVWERDNPAWVHSSLGMQCHHYHAERQHRSLIFGQCCNIHTFLYCLLLLIYAFHWCLLLLIEIVLCKFLCTCTTKLMLLVNNRKTGCLNKLLAY